MGPNLLIVVKDDNGTGHRFKPQITMEMTDEQIFLLIPLRYGPRIQMCELKLTGCFDSLFLSN